MVSKYILNYKMTNISHYFKFSKRVICLTDIFRIELKGGLIK